MSIDLDLDVLDTSPSFSIGEPRDAKQSAPKDDDTLTEFICASCGTTFLKPYKSGAKPSKCDDCKAMNVETPPKAAAKSSTKRSSNSSLGKLEKALSEQLTGMGAIIGLFQPFDGMVIAHNGATVAAALVKAAESNPRLRKALEGFITGSAYGEIAFALMGTMVPILANHDILPAHTVLFGQVPEEARPFFKGGSKAPKDTETQPESEAQMPVNMAGPDEYL